ncbi:hypothetical protein Btru_043494 [Bulinus truncatus]|nr:hypothetical protein Btru_043494 [Bulinus truncatus]
MKVTVLDNSYRISPATVKSTLPFMWQQHLAVLMALRQTSHDGGKFDLVSESGSHYKSQVQVKRNLPPHIHALLYGEMDELPFTLPYTGLAGSSFVSNRSLQMIFSKKPAPPTGPQHHKLSFQTKKKTKKEEREVSDGSIHKYRKFNEIVSRSRFGKIQFKDVGARCEVLPNWVLFRLESACRNDSTNCRHFRYESSPVPGGYTRLTRDQRKRYVELYKKFKNKYNDVMEYKSSCTRP